MFLRELSVALIFSSLILFIFGSVSAVEITRDSLEEKSEQPAVKKGLDICFGFFMPYASLYGSFDGKSEYAGDDVSVIAPKLKANTGLGGTLGLKFYGLEDGSGTIELSLYKISHDYTWMDKTGRAHFTGFSCHAIAAYERLDIFQPLLTLGVSLNEINVKNATDELADASYNGAALEFGAGFNLAVNRYLRLSTRFMYHRYWMFNSITVDGKNMDIDVGGDGFIHSNGLCLVVGLYTAVKIR